MFNKNFYPTPKELGEKMWGKLDKRYNFTDVLEPSAGKGDLVKVILEHKKYNGNLNVDTIELENDFHSILMNLDSRVKVVGDDFLIFRTYTEYDVIFANPPFDNGDLHLTHMIELASKQSKPCQIVCLLNAETIKNPYSKSRKHLLNLLEEYNAEIEYIEKAFSSAERKTDVETALVYIFIKPEIQKQSYFKEMFKQFEEKARLNTNDEKESSQLSTFVDKSQVGISKQEIDVLIETYEKHIELVRRKVDIENELKGFTMYVNLQSGSTFGTNFNDPYSFSSELNETIRSVRTYYWNKILDLPFITKHFTTSMKTKFRDLIKKSDSLEINYKNIHILLLSVLQNKNDLYLEMLVDYFKTMTRYHLAEYSKNIHYYNGWKTNNAYKINKKVILPAGYFSEYDYRDLMNGKGTLSNFGNNIRVYLNDFKRIAELFLNKEFDDFKVNFNEVENELIHAKLYKKGTAHITFKQLDVLEKINFLVGQHFNWLPTDDEIKANKEAQDFVNQLFPVNDLLISKK